MQAVLLAAGESSRFWPLCEGNHKSLVSLMGRPLIAWTLQALEDSGISEALIIQSPSGVVEESLRNFPSKLKLKYVQQQVPKGMGDALIAAKDDLRESFWLLHAHQFMADRWMGPMRKKRDNSGADLILCGQKTEKPWKYGMLGLSGDRVHKIIEKPSAADAPSDTRALGIYWLSKAFVKELERTPEQHYAFEETLNAFAKDHNVRVVVQDEAAVSLKYPWDLFEANKMLMVRHLKPYRAKSAKISPLAHIEGDVYIGENVKIYEYAVVKGPCYLGDGAVIGTHTLVRDHTDVEPGVVIGAHAEAARAIFQSGASTHSGYFGDSIFDAGAKIGAGTVTANVKVRRDEVRPLVKGEKVLTGRRSLGVIVGSDTQLGISVKTMPGTLIGARAFVGPGVLVDENVPSDARVLVSQEKIIKKRGRNGRGSRPSR